MKYVIDLKNKKEFLYRLNPNCDECPADMDVNDYSHYQIMIRKKENCKYRKKGRECDCLLYSGNIGYIFCEIASFDLENITEEIIYRINNYVADAYDNNFSNATSYISEEIRNIFANSFFADLINFYIPIVWIAYCYYNDLGVNMGIPFDYDELKQYSSFKNFMLYDIFKTISDIKEIAAYCSVHSEFLENNENLDALQYFGILSIPLNFESEVEALELNDSQLVIKPGEVIKTVLEYVHSEIKPDNIETFLIDSLSELAGISFSFIHSEKLTIRKCSNCGHYFVPQNRSDAKYCERKSPQDSSMTCREYGSKRLWYDKLKENATAKLSRNIYSAKQMLVKRNPDIEEYRIMFDYFKAQRIEWEKAIKRGEKSNEEYEHWLNEIKKKKVM